MRKLTEALCICAAWALIGAGPAAAAYFDKNGVPVDGAQYEKIVRQHEQEMAKIFEQGYGVKDKETTLPDPVLLRKKRIEQWKAFERSRSKRASRSESGQTGNWR